MDLSDIVGWIFLIILLVGMVWVLYIVLPDVYQEIKSYDIMQEECANNPDVCFCDLGSCSIKSSCSYTTINDGPRTGGCNHSKICEIVTKANWKEGIWEYDCAK